MFPISFFAGYITLSAVFEILVRTGMLDSDQKPMEVTEPVTEIDEDMVAALQEIAEFEALCAPSSRSQRVAAS